MRKLVAIAVIVGLVALLIGSIAPAAEVRVGTLVLRADGGFEPRLLPRKRFAPIRFQGYGNIRTTDGSAPPALQHVKVEFDRDGRLATAGLGVCPAARIEAASPQQARQRCRGALVGKGRIEAIVTVPGLKRVEIGSPLSLFNGPRLEGHPTVVGHAQARFPSLETYVFTVPIERRRGVFRYRASFDVPPLAGGYGALTHIEAKIGRRYRAGGGERSYVSARCSDYVLQTQGYFGFADGTVVYGSVFKGCTPR